MNMTVTLKQVSERIDYGFTTSATIDKVGPKFLRITDIDGSHVDWDSVPYCEATPSEYQKYALQNEDIVIARTGASTGRSQWVQAEVPAVFASYLVRIRVRPNFDSRFISYVLTSKYWHNFVSSAAHGKSAQPNMSAGAMAEFEFACPPLPQQRAISEVLGALDDKIAANVKLIASADALAETQFHAALHEATLMPLSSFAEFVNGKAFTKGASGTGRVVIRIAELNSGIGNSTVFSDARVDDKHIARSGDILFAWSGSLTLHRWFRDEAIVNQHIFKVLPADGIPHWLIYELLRNKLQDFKMIAANKATTMGHIQRKHLDEPVLIPNEASLQKIDRYMDSLWRTALNAERENQTLATTRDALLTQLISGKLGVKDVEALVESEV